MRGKRSSASCCCVHHCYNARHYNTTRHYITPQQHNTPLHHATTSHHYITPLHHAIHTLYVLCVCVCVVSSTPPPTAAQPNFTLPNPRPPQQIFSSMTGGTRYCKCYGTILATDDTTYVLLTPFQPGGSAGCHFGQCYSYESAINKSAYMGYQTNILIQEQRSSHSSQAYTGYLARCTDS